MNFFCGPVASDSSTGTATATATAKAISCASAAEARQSEKSDLAESLVIEHLGLVRIIATGPSVPT
jgi:hypothetical protein